MKTQTTTRGGKAGSKRRRLSGPIRWIDLPHDLIWEEVLDGIRTGSFEGSAEDSLKYVLRRRLPLLDASDHLRYADLECARLVRMLRLIRDKYRIYLEKIGCKPLAEMYWVVFRFAVVPSAVKLLREAASGYVINSKIAEPLWRKLYGNCWVQILPVPPELKKFTRVAESIEETITSLITEESFEQVLRGGPFGKDAQPQLALSLASVELQLGAMSLADVIKMRQTLWDRCFPWTECLARFFDATQEELFHQSEALLTDGRRAELAFVSLSHFEKIAHKHLIDLRREAVSSRNFGRDRWIRILRELDEKQLSIDNELTGTAKCVLQEVRRNGHKVKSWEESYNPTLRVSLDDGKIYSLRRELTHAIHNAAKRAQYKISKVWNTK